MATYKTQMCHGSRLFSSAETFSRTLYPAGYGNLHVLPFYSRAPSFFRYIHTQGHADEPCSLKAKAQGLHRFNPKSSALIARQDQKCTQQTLEPKSAPPCTLSPITYDPSALHGIQQVRCRVWLYLPPY